MRKKTLKNIGIIALAMAICFLPQISAMASIMYNGNQTMFLKQFVDSNQWTYVCSTSYVYGKDEVEVTLFNIYKDDGLESNYKKVKVNACIDGIFHGTKKVEIDDSVAYTIPVEHRQSGEKYLLYAMGNNPALDCRVTGVFAPN